MVCAQECTKWYICASDKEERERKRERLECGLELAEVDGLKREKERGGGLPRLYMKKHWDRRKDKIVFSSVLCNWLTQRREKEGKVVRGDK